MDKKYILEKLSKIDKNKYSISELGLFGSYAKNVENENSDIDVLKWNLKKECIKIFVIYKKNWKKYFIKK